ncbi:ribonuclease H-like domain-containing protein [Tanacetum coccineum]
MSVHNSDNGDDYIEDPVTLISKLDISDPLHLHPNDSTALTVVSIKLKRTENYQVWSCAMLLALEGKNKIGFIDGSCKRSNTDEVLGRQWDRVNVESHKVASGCIVGFSQRNHVAAFVSNVSNRNNFQRNNQNVNSGPRPNNLNNNRQGYNPILRVIKNEHVKVPEPNFTDKFIQMKIAKEAYEEIKRNKVKKSVISMSTWTPPKMNKVDLGFSVEKPPASARFSHRKPVKGAHEGGRTLGVAKPKKQDMLENTWKTITEGWSVPLTRHLRKSETWETQTVKITALKSSMIITRQNQIHLTLAAVGPERESLRPHRQS